MNMGRILLGTAMVSICCSCATHHPAPVDLAREIRRHSALSMDYTRGLCRGVVYEHWDFHPRPGRSAKSEKEYADGLADGAQFHAVFIKNKPNRMEELVSVLRKYGFSEPTFVGMSDSSYRAAILPMIDRELGNLLWPPTTMSTTRSTTRQK
jgi:hypothetical protein